MVRVFCFPIPSLFTPAIQASTRGNLLTSAAMLNISAEVMYLKSSEAPVSQKLRRRSINDIDRHYAKVGDLR